MEAVKMPWWCLVAGSQPAKPPLGSKETSALSEEKRADPPPHPFIVGMARKCAWRACGKTFRAIRRNQRYCGRRCRWDAQRWAA
jgi:hypothetical protein